MRGGRRERRDKVKVEGSKVGDDSESSGNSCSVIPRLNTIRLMFARFFERLTTNTVEIISNLVSVSFKGVYLMFDEEYITALLDDNSRNEIPNLFRSLS